MTISNLKKYKGDLDKLLEEATAIQQAFFHDAYGKEYYQILLKSLGGGIKKKLMRP